MMASVVGAQKCGEPGEDSAVHMVGCMQHCTASAAALLSACLLASSAHADCCDGADEPRGTCRNTCLDKSAGQVKELQEQMESYQDALTRKASAIKVANARRDTWATRKHTIDEDVAAKEQEVELLAGEH